jgi:hypothetical protein
MDNPPDDEPGWGIQRAGHTADDGFGGVGAEN